MLAIQCDTSRFRAPGNNNGFKCHTCRQFILFPFDCTAVTIMSVPPMFTVLRNATDGRVLHDCRRPPDPVAPLPDSRMIF